MSYAELHCLSNFSFLRGASHPEELVARAADLGYAAIAITDRNSLAGVVRAHLAAREHHIHLIIGAEITPIDAPPIVLLAPTRTAYARLSRLITHGRRRSPKGDCEIRLTDLLELAPGAGWVGLVLPTLSTAQSSTAVRGLYRTYKQLLGRQLYLAAELNASQPDAERLAQLFALSRSVGVPLVAANAVHYHVPDRRYLQDVLTCIREKCTLHDAGTRLFANAERHLRPLDEIARRYAPHAALLRRTVVIARRCAFTLDELKYEYPHELVPPGQSAMEYLEALTWAGAAERYASSDEATKRRSDEGGERGVVGLSIASHNSEHLSRELQINGDTQHEPGVTSTGQDISGSHRVAAGDGTRAIDLSNHDNDAERRALRPDSADAPGGGVGAIQHCSGARPAEPNRLHSLPENGTGFSDGAPDAAYPRGAARVSGPHPRTPIPEQRNRPCPPGSDPQPGEQAGLTSPPSFPPSLSSCPPSLPPSVHSLLQRELALIAELRYEHYFLTVWDLVRFARSRGILCQGRGSAANSAVCYCLGITAVDPARIDLLFERFVSKERNEPPDIDVDFEHERREEVFQYIYQKYGRERAAITAEVITYRPRSAVRDVGKALGLSLDRVDVLAKSLDWWSKDALPEEAIRAAGCDPHDRTIQMLVRLVRQLLGFPRHLSQHVGGFVITESPLCEIVPLENGAMPGRTFIEWDKDDIDALGLLKIDCLALGMLSAISKCFKMLRAHDGERLSKSDEATKRRSDIGTEGRRGRESRCNQAVTFDARHDDQSDSAELAPPQPSFPPSLRRSVASSLSSAPTSLHTIPPEDPAVYDMICAADTVGVFQIESRAQMSMLPRLRPRSFYDLVIEVAIVRPGPIQGGMIHPYLRRRHGEEPVIYPSEAVRDVLAKTLGIPLFQEQVMRLAVVAAGFTPGEADQLRRSMAAWRIGGQIHRFQTRLIEGMLANGYSPQFAEQIYKQIQGFGEYGFPESHAASFALLVYASAWLKHHHPAAFTAAVINAQPMGFYAPAQLVRDAQRHGVTVLPVDVNQSAWDCGLESDEATRNRSDGGGGPALRLGYRLVRGLSAEKVRGVEAARQEKPIKSIYALARRHDVSRETLLRLAAADAFRSLGVDRRAALWQILALDDAQLPLFEDLEPSEPPARLPAMTADETVVHDYDALGLSLNAHPLGLVRDALKKLRVSLCEKLRTARHRQPMAVAGLVTHRQRPSTASGIVFMTLEDESGTANLIIRPRVWDRYKAVGRTKTAILATGTVERAGDVVHVQVARLEDLTRRLAPVRTKSRDFC